jgi:hypothetical protein
LYTHVDGALFCLFFVPDVHGVLDVVDVDVANGLEESVPIGVPGSYFLSDDAG